jgi:hypothetical protein
MDIKLLVTAGKNKGFHVSVTGPRFLIGRAADCQLRPGSDQIAEHHCAIITAEGLAKVQDLGSPAGTFVNGQRVAERCELKTGDRLRIGPLEFEVQLTVDVGGKKRPKIQNIHDVVARTIRSAAPDGDIGDVSDWLTRTDAEKDVLAPTEIAPPDPVPGAGGPATSETASPQPDPPAPAAGHGKSRSGGSSSSNSADSRAAAEEALRRMLGQ